MFKEIPIYRRVILSLFITGRCLHCNKVISKPSLSLRGDYAYHMLSVHGIRVEDFINILNTKWHTSLNG